MIKLRKMSDRPLLDSERDALLAVARAAKALDESIVDVLNLGGGRSKMIYEDGRLGVLKDALAALPEGWDR